MRIAADPKSGATDLDGHRTLPVSPKDPQYIVLPPLTPARILQVRVRQVGFLNNRKPRYDARQKLRWRRAHGFMIAGNERRLGWQGGVPSDSGLRPFSVTDVVGLGHERSA